MFTYSAASLWLLFNRDNIPIFIPFALTFQSVLVLMIGTYIV